MQSQVTSPAPPNQGAGETAVKFLQALDPDGWHHLDAFSPASGLPVAGKTFPPGAWADVARWVSERDGRFNIYASVNEPVAGAGDGKLSKDRIANLRAAFADKDPAGGAAELASERARLFGIAAALLDGDTPPTFAIDTGGGVQFVWRLAEKLPANEWRQAVEDQNRGIRDELESDAVQNIDRIMRLPGTMNIPTAEKRAKGRTERRAAVINDTRSSQSFRLEQIAQRFPPVPEDFSAKSDRSPEIAELMRSIDMGEVVEASEYAYLPRELRSKFERACVEAPRLGDLWKGDETALRSRRVDDRTASVWRFSLAHELHRSSEEFSATEFGMLLWVWEYAVQPGHDLEAKIVPRTIARDWIHARPEVRADADPAKWFDVLEDEPANDNGAKNEVAPAKRRFTFVSADEAAAAALSTTARPLVKGLLDQGTASVVFGDTNVGKSFLVLDMAFHISTGRPWAGMKTAKTRVAYLVAEGGSGIHRRALALRDQYGEAGDIHFLIAPINLWNSSSDVKDIVDGIRALGDVGLIVIDTVSRALAGGDENSSEAMGAFVSNLTKIQLATKAHVLGVHHSGKDVRRGARGWSGLKAAVDTEIEVLNDNGRRTFTSTKQRDLVGQRAWSFQLRTVTLGLDEDGDPITSCTVSVANEGANEADRPASVTTLERSVLAALALLEKGCGHEHSGPGQSIDAVRCALNADLADEDKLSAESVRRHLSNLVGKKLVVKPSTGRFALTSEGAKTGTTAPGLPIAQDNLSGGAVVDTGGSGAEVLFQ
jgi:hypothetical protein